MERDINVVVRIKDDGTISFVSGDGLPLQMGGGEGRKLYLHSLTVIVKDPVDPNNPLGEMHCNMVSSDESQFVTGTVPKNYSVVCTGGVKADPFSDVTLMYAILFGETNLYCYPISGGEAITPPIDNIEVEDIVTEL